MSIQRKDHIRSLSTSASSASESDPYPEPVEGYIQKEDLSMNTRLINSINGRMSLRDPQRESLEILARVCEIIQLGKQTDLASALDAIKREYPKVSDFERDFPSLCFALATGVGKTRLMGAFISYLYTECKVRNFFVLAPNLTIYNKLIADFTPNTSKYVFTGIAEFSVDAPLVITGETYERIDAVRDGKLFDDKVHINVFNISKINSEVRGDKSPRIKRLSEYIGQSYYDYLASLPDLVLIMDESHRYRASAGIKAINELKPVLGLELTATPFVESGQKTVYFRNTVYEFPLSRAMEKGYVKEPAVVTQKNFVAKDFTEVQIERIKLEDGVRVHEDVKVELATYARQSGRPRVKPFILVIARDTSHAADLLKLIQSEAFFDGRYAHKVIQVDSSTKEDELVERLLRVESADEPTEIVIHVNMLKEGWDVTNLYTIIPLRKADARTLVEQSIGRGLRLPYNGKRTGVAPVDRLNIIAHDRFQEIIDEANRPDSAIRLSQYILDPIESGQTKETVLITSNVEAMFTEETPTNEMVKSVHRPVPVFSTPEERAIGLAVHRAIKKKQYLPTIEHLDKDEIQQELMNEVSREIGDYQTALPGAGKQVNLRDIVKTVTKETIRQTIAIPRITVIPKGEVSSGFHPFGLDCTGINYQPVNHDLVVEHLRTHEQQTIRLSGRQFEERRPEDYIVRGLIGYDDISYDDNNDLLYDLSGQMVAHLATYLNEEELRDVLIYHQRQLCEFIHTQMLDHQWQKQIEYEIEVREGFTELKESVVTGRAGDERYDFRKPVKEKNQISKMIFNGFSRCLYAEQKFHSDSERRFAVLLDRDADKWFRPVKGQFNLYYRLNHEQFEYVPDFVAESATDLLMVEVKSTADMNDADVIAKKESGVLWCNRASEHTKKYGGKTWRYLLVPHDRCDENMTLEGLRKMFEC